MSGKFPLILVIRDEIREKGAIPFSRFMELALYHPDHGYYASSSPTGRTGDFYTSVSVGALFGQLMAQQFEQMWEILDKPLKFALVEQGANDGRFAIDVLHWMEHHRPDLFQAVRYHLIEPLESLRLIQEQNFRKANLLAQIRWDRPEATSGIFFSNELVDSFPVHRVIFREGQWLESHVSMNGDNFQWEDLPITNASLVHSIKELPLPAIEGYATEINLEARSWIASTASLFEKGFFLTVDYGYLEDQYYDVQRNEGTLLCYQRHRRSTNPLDAVGEQDITAHVDFSALIKGGELNGLKTLGFTDQHHFMIGLAHDDLISFESRGLHLDPHYGETTRAFKTLMHPEIMGGSFKYLLQSKGITSCPSIKGLRFART